MYDLVKIDDDMLKTLDKHYKISLLTVKDLGLGLKEWLDFAQILPDTNYIGYEIKCPYCGNTYKIPFNLYNKNNLIECLSCHGKYQQSLNIIGICVDPIQK